MTRVLFVLIATAVASGQPPAQTPAAQSARQAAPVDLTGNWVSIVTEDWRWRMTTPLKGDSASIPVNDAARKIIDAWDPAKDEAAGLQCKSYGAPAIMRVPGRLRISWQDDNTLKMETDAGTQTRVFHFTGTGPASEQPSWQGYSAARWERSVFQDSLGFGLGLQTRAGSKSRTLIVNTTNLREGYLRKNGVPYSARATVSEYYDRFQEPNGDQWFTVTTVVTDPVYLAIPFVTTTDFKKEADGTRWNPSPCVAK